MISYYFKFERLSEELRTVHKIKSTVRLDCTEFSSFGESYKMLDKLKNAKNHLVVYPNPCREVVKVNLKRRADFDELLNFKMMVEIDKSIKVRLLQAIQAGELDRDLFPKFTIQPIPFIELMMRANR